MSSAGKRVALVDPLWTGHHPTYLDALTRALFAEGQQPVVFCPRPDEMKNLLCNQDRQRASIVEYDWPRDTAVRYSRLSDRRIAIQRLRHLTAALRAWERESNSRFDMVFLACMDLHIGSFQTRWDWDCHFSWPFSGILFSVHHLHNPIRYSMLHKGPFDPIHALRSRWCVGAGLLDEDMVAPLSHKLSGTRILDWPDITDGTSEGPTNLSRQVRSLARGRKVVGMLGSIAARKGMLELLATFRQLPADKFFLVVAGTTSPDHFEPSEWNTISAFLNNPPENAWIHLQRIPDGNEFNALVSACDVLWLAYRDFAGSSNMLTKSALFRIPVIVSDGHLMARRVQRYSLGFSVQEGNISDMVQLLQQPALHNRSASPIFQVGCQAYAKRHDFECLRARFRIVLSSLPSCGPIE